MTAVRLPPLRERDGDVEVLTDHFNAVLSARHDLPPCRFTAEAMRRMEAYGWPGNLRELRNRVESHLLMAEDPEAWLDEPAAPATVGETSLGAAEQAAIAEAVRRCGGNLTAAARALGVSRSTLYRKMESMGLCPKPRPPSNVGEAPP